MSMNTFPHDLIEVIAENGVNSIWPTYEGGCLNANQWYSICMGFDAKQRFFYCQNPNLTSTQGLV